MDGNLDLDAVRRALPACASAAYMNTGTAGPLPEPAADALRAALAAEVEHGRGGGRGAPDHMAAARSAVARLLDTPVDRIALMHHTSGGLNAAALGVRFRPGDVVVTTDLEHAAIQLVVGALRLRHGVEVRIARLGREGHSPPAALAALRAAMGPAGPVRAVFLSHVSYATGAVLPVAEIAAAAHAVGATVVVDGAQAVGALAVRPADLGADFYTVSGQKWLCGPEGTGALWAAPGQEERLQPGAVGYMGVARIDEEGHYLPAPGARRLEVGMAFRPALAGWVAAMGWLEGLGWEAVGGRIHALAERARAALGSVRGVDVLTPAGPGHAGLVSFRVAGLAAEAAVGALRERGYLVRSIPGWDAVRVSCAFFLRDAEIDGLAEAVAAIAPPGP